MNVWLRGTSLVARETETETETGSGVVRHLGGGICLGTAIVECGVRMAEGRR